MNERDDRERQREGQHHLTPYEQVVRRVTPRSRSHNYTGYDSHEARDKATQKRAELDREEALHHYKWKRRMR